MGVSHVPDPTLRTIGNQVNFCFHARYLETSGYQQSALFCRARGQLKEDAIIITHLITDPYYYGMATH